ncbi:MAG: PfkB family carbohydrate kinase, partial [Rubripirellula sp.]
NVAEILQDVDSLKLNVEELEILTGHRLLNKNAIELSAAELLSEFSIGSLWVTAGADGAYYFDDTGQVEFGEAFPLERMVDTVGAGDAFASVVIDGLLSDKSPKQILSQAVRFASRVCGLPGATTDNKQFYQSI